MRPLSIPVSLCLLHLLLSTASGQTDKKPSKVSEAEDFSLDLPTPDKLFRPESEAQAKERIRAAAAQNKTKATFPADAPLPYASDPNLQDRPHQVISYPAFVSGYRPSYFEDPRTEVYLQSLGVLEPIRSAFLFYGKAMLLPVKLLSWRPHR